MKMSITLAVLAVILCTAPARAGFHLVHAMSAAGLDAWCAGLEGFDHTQVVTGPGGSMVWLSGDTEPGLESGMTELGGTYAGVWSDTDKLAVYSSVYPPDIEGNPRPFGVFMGCEEDMGL